MSSPKPVPVNVWHSMAYASRRQAGPRQNYYCPPRGSLPGRTIDLPWDEYTFLAVTYYENGWQTGGLPSSAGALGIWQITSGHIGALALNQRGQELGLGESAWRLLARTIWNVTDVEVDLLQRGIVKLCEWDPVYVSDVAGLRNNLTSGFQLGDSVLSPSDVLNALGGPLRKDTEYVLTIQPSPSSAQGEADLTIDVALQNRSAYPMHGTLLGLEYPAEWQYTGMLPLVGNINLRHPSSQLALADVLLGGDVLAPGESRQYSFNFHIPAYDETLTKRVIAWVTGDNVSEGVADASVNVGPLAALMQQHTATAATANGSGSSVRLALKIPQDNAALAIQVTPNPHLVLPSGQSANLSIKVTNVTFVPTVGVVVTVTGAQESAIPVGALAAGETKEVRWSGLPSGVGYINVQATALGALPAFQFIPVTFVQGGGPPPAGSGISPLVLLGGLAAVGGAAYVASRRERG